MTACVISSGCLQICEMLVKAGTDLNVKTQSGETALIMASYNGHPKVCAYVKHGGWPTRCLSIREVRM